MVALIPVRCENIDEHEAHDTEKAIIDSCNGHTICGEHSHAPHTFPKLVSYRCPGICKCGDTNRGVHGYGSHK